VGVVVGLPALRVKGIYLGIATLSFGFIVEEVLARWESVTGGNAGIHVKAARPVRLEGRHSAKEFYYLCLVIAVLATLGILNLLRSPTGRAFVAIRDSEISAQSMGITWRATRRCRSPCRRRWPASAARCMRTSCSSSRPTSSTSCSRSTCC
jgi:branched-chain amino acid transport system permease protein